MLSKKLIIALPLLIATNVNAHSESFETYGDIGQIAIPLTALFVAWSKGDTEGMWQLGKGWAYTQGITHTLKHAIKVQRPNGSDFNSFPSGHTSSAFSGAAFLHHRYGLKYGLPAYIAATAVGASRVDASKHWETDVLAGAAIAYTVSYFVTSLYDNPDLIIAPTMMGKDAQGIIVSYRF